MDSSKALKYHIKTFRLAGVWPVKSERYPLLYHIWTIIVFVLLGILFPFSQVLNIFFADSIMEMVDRSVITSSVVVVVIKAVNLYHKRNGLTDLFNELKKLDDDIKETSHIIQMNSTIKIGCQLYFTFLFPYISTCIVLVFQTIFSKPESRLWSSTYAYPFDWTHETHIYISGLFIQGIANSCIVIFAVAADTYGVILIHIISTHIGILQERLERLGKTEHTSAQERFDELIYCCKSYDSILRWSI